MAQRRAPAVILAAGLIASGVIGWMAWSAMHAQQEFRLLNAADRARADIDARIDDYIEMLRGCAGLFAASEEVTRAEFAAYVRRLEMPVHYPGVQGIGYSVLVPAAGRQSLLRHIRAGGVADFHFWTLGPDGKSATPPPDTVVHAVLYLEPNTPENHVALGFDMSTEAVRRDAMDRARDTGRAAATGRVRLVQELDPAKAQAGFLVYAPVYRGGDIPRTIAERRALLTGYVYSPFRADDLLGGTLGPAERSELRFAVYDGALSETNRLHLSAPFSSSGRMQVIRHTEVAGRTWTLAFQPGPAFPRAHSLTIGLSSFIACAALTLVLFIVTRTEVRGRRLAEQTAEGLRRSEEALRAANAEKDEFLTVISHELRTPLNAILGWASMLRNGQVTDANRERALTIIERNAVAQTKLVEDLLDTSRAVGGRLRLNREEIDIAAVLDPAIESIRPAAAAGSVALAWNRPRDLGMMFADPARLQQIVGNLLSNAVKFTPAGGRITVDARRARGELTIRVADTGIGIAPDFLPHVFDRFRQADTSTTRTRGGVGLGLSIVLNIVDLHGGRVEVLSGGVGQGSTFVVTLPVDRRAGHRTSKDAGAENPSSLIPYP